MERNETKRLIGTHRIVIGALISVGLLQCLYWQWPRSICFDATFSLFAAQNAVRGAGFVTVDPNDPYTGDLTSVKQHWLTGWPPGLSFAYVALLSTGLTPGAATNAIVAILLLIGTIGWAVFSRRAGVGPVATCLLSVIIPWTYFVGSALVVLLSDHLVWALTPWCFVLLLDLPETRRKGGASWARLILTALAFGLLELLKYSALPLILGAGIYFLLRDWPNFNRRKSWQSAVFAAALIMPSVVLYVVNHTLMGTATSQVRFSPALHEISFKQAWDILVLPMSEISGWGAVAWHAKLPVWSDWIFGIPIIVIILILGWTLYHDKSSFDSRSISLLIVMTGSMWLFLVALAVISGDVGEWTTQGRYSVPVMFGWYCLAIAVLSQQWRNTAIAAIMALVLAPPLVAGIVAAGLKPFRQPCPRPLPYSRLASASPSEASAFEILHKYKQSDLSRPSLIIGTQAEAMNELLVPAIPWFCVERTGRLYSSKPLVVWALLDDAASDALLRKLDASVTVASINTPPDCPWKLTFLTFRPDERNSKISYSD